jgi:hypothetical protein
MGQTHACLSTLAGTLDTRPLSSVATQDLRLHLNLRSIQTDGGQHLGRHAVLSAAEGTCMQCAEVFVYSGI